MERKMREKIMGSKDDFNYESKWDVLILFPIFLVLLLCLIMFMAGFYHIFLEQPPAPERLPYEMIVYDRSNKAVVEYEAVCEVKDGVLHIQDATEMSREDVSHLIE